MADLSIPQWSGERSRSLCKSIGEQAQLLGFELFGVTTPDPPAHLDVFMNWLNSGRHGEMSYLAEARSLSRRADPRQILPECRSILVLGVRYPAPVSGEQNAGQELGSIAGRVASYAWGEDYHDVLSRRLAALVSAIEAEVGAPVPNRWYTDTGPVLERELAQRAGLGWIGKNTCLIHPQKGSYFLLAEILLGLELEPDPPFLFDRCGACTRCLDACPTGCILPDRTIDARRCISYLTIELKGVIPEELRPALGYWIFGCDICQQVCPWNQRFAEAVFDPAFKPRPEIAHPDLSQELLLTPEGFNKKFKSSPQKRAKRRGYLRNTAIALGNTQKLAAVPSLAAGLSDPEPLVRQHAAWALGRIGYSEARAALLQARRTESDPDVRAEIQFALLGNSQRSER